MEMVDVERLGGLAGFGLPGSRLRSRGQVDPARLASADRQRLEALFARRAGQRPPLPDGFRYRLTRRIAGRTEVIEVDEEDLPLPVRDCVQDELN